MKGKKKVKREILADPIYNRSDLARFINYLMRKGKKNLARKIVYGALEIIKEKTKKEPLEIFEKAIENARPFLAVRPKRIGGATYQVPVEVKEERGRFLSMSWIIRAAKQKKGKSMREKLAEELINASNNTGWAVKKKVDTHKMAEANRAFAHFAW